MDGRDSSSTVGAVEGIYTGLETGRIGGHAEILDSGEEMWVIAEAMGIHPNPHTPKTDSHVGKPETGTKLV